MVYKCNCGATIVDQKLYHATGYVMVVENYGLRSGVVCVMSLSGERSTFASSVDMVGIVNISVNGLASKRYVPPVVDVSVFSILLHHHSTSFIAM